MKKIFFLFVDLLNLLRLLLNRAFQKNIMNISLLKLFTNENCILIGNGPSLANDIDTVFHTRKGRSLYSVNYFALSEYFDVLKPDIYIMTDPIFWRTDINDDFKRDNYNLFSKFENVDWKMLIVSPFEGYPFISSSLKSNPNLSFLWVKSNGSHFFNKQIYARSIQTHISTPIFQNVMILTLWLCLMSGAKKIEMYGVDFSGFKDYEVDQSNNQINSKSSHFYKNTKAQSNATNKYNNVRQKMMHDRLHQSTIAFRQMYLLSLVARFMNIIVLNRSSFSFLDSFHRQPSH